MRSTKDLVSVPGLDDIRTQSINDLMRHDGIRAFVEANHIDQSTLNRFWAELLDYEEDHRPCASCPGLDDCPKVSKGLSRTLVYDDGAIVLPLTHCRYGEEQAKKQRALTRVLYNNLSPTIIMNGFSDNATIKNTRTLSRTTQLTVQKILTYTYGETGLYISSDAMDKTELMGALMNHMALDGHDVALCHFPTFLIDMKASFKSYNDDASLSQLMNAECLMLDGLGEENVTAWSRDEILMTILSHRALNHLPLFVTSSYRLSELASVYSLNHGRKDVKAEKTAARISAMCEELRMG